MIAARILGTGSAVPGGRHTTAELCERSSPGRDPAELERRTGISTRYWLEPHETATSLAAAALGRALAAAGLAATDLRRIVFVSSTGGDYRIPATANGVAAALGLDDSCDGFDVHNSCAGFLSGFDIGARSVATGLGPVGVVAVETFSRDLSPAAYRAYLVLGDAAAAVVLGPARAGEGVLSVHLRNSAALRGQMGLPLPTPGARTHHDFAASNDELTASALGSIRRATATVLAEAALALDDVAWFLPHQPNGEMLAQLVQAMGVDPARLVRVVHEIGSVGSASVPSSLDRLMRTRPVRAGDRILMATVGAGTAYGAILYQVAP